MRFINAWAFALANGLMKQLKENNEKRRVYYYGFQIIIGALVKGVLLIGISTLLGALVPTLLVTLFFSSLRVVAGGYHMDTYGKCIITALAVLIAAGVFVQYTWVYWPFWMIALLSVVIFFIGVVILLKYAPADTPNKRITKPQARRKFKMLSLTEILVWFVLTQTFIFLKYNMAALSACFGVAISLFTASPTGYKFFDMISGKVGQIKI